MARMKITLNRAEVHHVYQMLKSMGITIEDIHENVAKLSAMQLQKNVNSRVTMFDNGDALITIDQTTESFMTQCTFVAKHWDTIIRMKMAFNKILNAMKTLAGDDIRKLSIEMKKHFF